MLYTPLTKKALRICFDAHKDQLDKSGLPYVFHPFHLAEQMETEDEICVALLHDVVEDTDITIDDLRAQGFNANILTAIDLMTHQEGVPYLEYVTRIAPNPLARKVKIADLHHNSDPTRLDTIIPRDIERAEKYAKALAILEAE
ncbi:MAG: GTP pyrophosphokinase [Coriobacteriales bacterium]|nr:GTP pyrophosphokinase [Coriobacteriales bacterium]